MLLGLLGILPPDGGALVGEGEMRALPSCILYNTVAASAPLRGKQECWFTYSMSPFTSFAISNEGAPYRLTAPDVNIMPSSFCFFNNTSEGTMQNVLSTLCIAKDAMVLVMIC